MSDPKDYPEVDGAPLNPYDLPGEPRPGDDVPDEGPTADESADVPGPGGNPVEPTTADTTGKADMGAGDVSDEDEAEGDAEKTTPRRRQS